MKQTQKFSSVCVTGFIKPEAKTWFSCSKFIGNGTVRVTSEKGSQYGMVVDFRGVTIEYEDQPADFDPGQTAIDMLTDMACQ